MRNFFLILSFLSLTFSGFAQVKAVDLLLDYNETTSEYDVSLVIVEGNTTQNSHRVQFNAQIALVTLDSIDLTISNRYNPIQNNIDMMGTDPMDWFFINKLFEPSQTPELSYFAINPTLNPTSFYNNLSEGDTVLLFSLQPNVPIDCPGKVRLLDENIDVVSIQGLNFQQGFSIGGPNGINNFYNRFPYLELQYSNGELTFTKEGDSYELYEYEANELVATSDNNSFVLTKPGTYYGILNKGTCSIRSERLYVGEVPSSTVNLLEPQRIYPNPAHNVLYVEHISLSKASLVDAMGRSLPISIIDESTLDISSLPPGIYFILFNNSNKMNRVRFVKG